MGIVTLAAIALFILAFGLISGRIQKSVISPPMVFVLFGLLVSNRVLGVIDLTAENEIIRTVAELTLVLVLFTDASRINLSNLRREHNIPVRLLSLGLPLCIVFGTLLAAIVFDYLSFLEGAILATILAPTDAALGQAVVSSPRVPVRIRQALNVESGLNDGIALPILLFFISVAGAAEQTETSGFWIRFAAMQLVLGPIVGIAVGFFGGKLVEQAGRTEWMSRTFQELAALGLSFLAYALAEMVNGNGFISAFCAGLTLGNTSRAVCTCLYEFAAAKGHTLHTEGATAKVRQATEMEDEHSGSVCCSFQALKELSRLSSSVYSRHCYVSWSIIDCMGFAFAPDRIHCLWVECIALFAAAS